MAKIFFRSRSEPREISSWTWEIVAMISNVASFIALTITLFIYDGKPVSHWNFPITLNTIVSILSTVSKTTLLFAVAEAMGQWKWILLSWEQRPVNEFERVDAASRGPWGSTKLLWPSPGIPKTLHIGAVVTCLALAFDPFTQQLIQYEQNNFPQYGNTTVIVGRTERYDRGTLNGINGTLPNGTLDSAIDPQMQLAILSGLLQDLDTLIEHAPYSCDSNCTWPPFQSLAVSSMCTDLTHNVTTYKEANGLYYDLTRTNKTISEANAMTSRLPNGLLINNFYIDPETDDFQGGGILMTSFGTGNASRTNTFQQSDSLIWSMSFLVAAGHNTTIRAPSRPEAFECGLFYQVKEYNAFVENGKYHESETIVEYATRNHTSYKPYGDTLVELTPSDIESIDFDSSSSKQPRTDLQFGSFNVSDNAVKSISSYFHQTFAVQATFDYTSYAASHEGYSDVEDLHGPNGYYLQNERNGNFVYAPNVMRTIYTAHGLYGMNKTFKGIAVSMTNAMREIVDKDSKVYGTATVMITLYKIHWSWIALQTVLTSFGSVFLLITIWRTALGDVPVWKSSVLAPLVRPEDIGRFLFEVKHTRRTEEREEMYHVRLCGNNTSAHDESPESGRSTSQYTSSNEPNWQPDSAVSSIQSPRIDPSSEKLGNGSPVCASEVPDLVPRQEH